MSFNHLLPPRTYTPPVQSLPPDRGLDRNTIIEDEPQEIKFYLPNHRHFTRLSTIVDDSPTGETEEMTYTATLQRGQRQAPSKPAEFNDLYDLTDNEADDIPIHITVSLTNTPTKAEHTVRRFPSIVIPSPSTWPTIHNFKKGDDAMMLSPDMLSPAIVSPTPHALSQFAARTLDDASSRAPSLDGSLTSEELSNLSCPSTPDIERQGTEAEWSSPVQLHPQALQTLDSLTGVEREDGSPKRYVAEMREVAEQRPQLGVDVNISVAMTEESSTELSALSVPSPGGFFSGLEPSARHAWLPTPVEQPSTTIAERFYGVPWASTSEPLDRVVELDTEDNNTEGPSTARWNPLISPKSSLSGPRSSDLSTTEFLLDPTEYKEHYQEELREVSTANLDRTTLWLRSQGGLCGKDDKSPDESLGAPVPNKKNASISSLDSVSPPTPPKSVRFVTEPVPAETIAEKTPVLKESIFVRGFEHLQETRKGSDAFVHRKTRAEALRLDRKCLFTSHLNRLESKYEVRKEERVGSFRPVSDFFTGEVSEENDAIATATRERRALEQIKPIAWNLEATKMLNGGTLLTSPTGKIFPKINDGKILDLGGQASCDWAWQVAIEHPNSSVNTVYTGDQFIDTAIESPTNHKQTRVPNLWTLPYANNHFHLISARNLFTLLKTDKPTGRGSDEYDLCLRECLRVLKPGGYLEFSLVDADIMGAGRQASALSVEFCFNLKTRGYDCTPTKQWLPRLRKAGFSQVRRAWLTLPLAQPPEKEGTTADASYISGLVGSWAWERWMLKLHKEMGKDADHLLHGVPAAMEEGARTGASWRYLSGWARKPM
jgi:hypothetical protein